MSWYQYLSIIREAEELIRYYNSAPPQACPEDGEPLLRAPADRSAVLFCRFCGWSETSTTSAASQER